MMGDVEGGADAPRTIAVFCVGNKLMLDDGVGPAVYEELLKRYDIPDNVTLFDLGCLTLNMIERVREYDVIITVDAVDGTDAEPGTVFRFAPDAMARHSGATASLHDLKLVDLFDAATLLGYEAEGLCLGMQVEEPVAGHGRRGPHAEGGRRAAAARGDGGGGAGALGFAA